MKKRSILRLTAALLLVTAMGFGFFLLPVRDYISQFLEQVKEMGTLGPVLLAALYIPACLLFLPGWILTMGAGFAFGVVRGTIAVSVGSTLGAVAAFLVGRTLARDWIEQKVAGNARFRAIDRAVGQQGFKIVLLTRLSPIFPFNLLNYAFGITKVSLRDYVLASWIGMLPGTVMYVYLGSAVKSLSDLVAGKVDGGVGQKVLFALGLLATIAVTVLVTRIARKALQESISTSTSDLMEAMQPGENYD